LARDCQTYKCEIIEAIKGKTKGDHPKKGKGDIIEDDEGGYPNIEGVMITFRGPQAYEDRRHEKITRCLIFTTVPVVPIYLRWSERSITFNRDDHPDHVIKASRFSLVVSAVVGGINMTKVFMDGGSDINILYKDAFEKLNIETSKLLPLHSPFHGIVPERRVMPLGTITLSVMFGDQVHYCKETLSFEVIDF
jgi:hypothetical protein